MATYTFVIETDEKSKGRSFHGILFAWVLADSLWSRGSGDTYRPAWALVGASDQEAAPVMANMRLGQKAVVNGEGFTQKGERFEWMRSAGYTYPTMQRYVWDRPDGDGTDAGCLINPMLSNLFTIDPGPVRGGVDFIVMPKISDVAYQMSLLGQHAAMMTRYLEEIGAAKLMDPEYLAIAPAMALLFCGYLVTRCEAPIYSDLRYQAQVYASCLARGLASWSWDDKIDGRTWQNARFGRHKSLGYVEVGTADMGLAPGVAMRAAQKDVESMLAEELTTFSNRVGINGKTAEHSNRRMGAGAGRDPAVRRGADRDQP